ncbi:methyltransferase domain-containing protein [Afipia felis]|uniref:methyltransferase domain-containing protein n=1 Tax=Afipia felis TaxID=1035 RepID=UPI0009D9966E|nr:class I SAM-dependent methyltransferase [Afipia felis]
MSAEKYFLEVKGFCPICHQDTAFHAYGPWLRGTFYCQTCEKGSVPRERALALVLSEVAPNWRYLKIHESSPAPRGISIALKRDCPQYIGSHYYPDKPFGSLVDGWRNEDLRKQTFEDGGFDLVISLDVMEHVFHPDEVFKEIHRTLKPGGMYVSTFPIHKHQVGAAINRAVLDEDG